MADSLGDMKSFVNGFVSSKIELKPGKYGFGLFVKSDVKKDEVLLDIPTESAFRAKSKCDLGLNNVTENLTESDLLAVSLLVDLKSGRIKNYFEKMNLYELPFEWDTDEINCLPVECRRTVMHTKKIISHLEWKMNESASANKTDLVSRADIVNAFRMVHSRQVCQFNSPVVIPVMDFLNHSKYISNVGISQTGTSYKCQASQDIKQGDEIFIDYGRESDAFYLCNFGFVDSANNKNNCVQLSGNEIVNIISNKLLFKKVEYNDEIITQLGQWVKKTENADLKFENDSTASIDLVHACKHLSLMTAETQFVIMERILKSTKTDLEASYKKAKNPKLKNILQTELSILNKYQNSFPNDF